MRRRRAGDELNATRGHMPSDDPTATLGFEVDLRRTSRKKLLEAQH
jgi:hypothetical protein